MVVKDLLFVVAGGSIGEMSASGNTLSIRRKTELWWVS